MDEKTKQEVREFSKRVLDKFGNLIKSIVVFGSVTRGEAKPESDIDILVILDDTLPEFSSVKLEVIDNEMEKIAKSISEKISLQPSYTLTEFFDYARSGHPIVYNFIKEGEPIYDTGFFITWKRLLKMGKIQGTREAIESYMEDAPKKLARAKTVKLLMLAEDCYYSMVNSAQAVLMFMGVEPPVPSKIYEEFTEYLVKPGIVEEEYANWLKEIVKIRKDIEHKRMLEAKGEFVDMWIERAEKFVDKMFMILNALEIRKKEKILERTYEVMLKAVSTALKTIHKIPEDMQISDVEKSLGLSLKDAFKRDFIDTKKVDGYYLEIWNRLEELKKKVFEERKLEVLKGNEVEQLREYVRKLINELSKVVKE
ncbi:MAG: nucleotidyltransferase domain-containing protein [Candidatus Aenigmarchaeota archaeon]|nr:nucleotidyltransferase domain-containing protein [Candidatus Aenigmarchaeota archaeon]MDW8160349.1 nucleotidyltransferase domain-containing protein [Candidatus Aenigmarchaeota archaeon]